MAVKHHHQTILSDDPTQDVSASEWNDNHDVDDNTLVAAKLAASATDVLFGRATASAGPGEEIPLTSFGRALIGAASLAAQKTILGIGNQPLTPTAVKTGAYSAAAGDFVPVDTTSGGVAILLPTTPADLTQVGIKHVIRGSTNAVTINRGGSAVFNKASGSTSLSLTTVLSGVVLLYKASTDIWYVIAADAALVAGTDYYAPGGTDVAVVDGGTGSSTAAGARTNLGVAIGSNVQAWDTDLDAIAAIAPANDDIVQRKAGAWTNRTMAQLKTDLALVIGTNVEAWDADLDAIAGLTSAADSFPFFTGSHTASFLVIASAIRTLLGNSTVLAFRKALGISKAYIGGTGTAAAVAAAASVDVVLTWDITFSNLVYGVGISVGYSDATNRTPPDWYERIEARTTTTITVRIKNNSAATEDLYVSAVGVQP